MALHIHKSRPAFRAGEPSSESNSLCYFALFGFEILHRPFAQFLGRSWNRMMASHLVEAWNRQVQMIQSLHITNSDFSRSPVYELRFIANPSKKQVDIFFLGKVLAHDAEQACKDAVTLSREVFSLFPFDFDLRPLSDSTAFEKGYQSNWLANLTNFEQIVEIRRFERLVPTPGNGQHLLYLTHNWQWHLQNMEQVWCALAKYEQPLMLSISLSPFTWEPADYVYLNEVEATMAGENFAGLTPEIRSANKLYRQLLYQTPRPFTMRTVLVGEPAVPRGLANAMGVSLCLPRLQAETDEALISGNYTLTWPSCLNDFLIAKQNLVELSQHDWGDNLVTPPVRRWRYAVNAKQAQAAFRIPIPPEAGFPDISLGQEMDQT